MSVLDAPAQAIIAGLPARGVPTSTLSTSTPGTLLQTLLADLLPLLQQCIPAAKTADGLLAALKQVGDRILGLGLRVRIGEHIRASIIQYSGNDQDAKDLIAQLQVPLKQGITEQCGLFTLDQCTQLLAEQSAGTLPTS